MPVEFSDSDALPSPAGAAAAWRRAEAALEEMIAHQEIKLLRLARRIVPHVTPEDLRNVHDFPEIERDPIYNFEDGTLSGLIAARVALKARVFGPLSQGEEPAPALSAQEVLRNMAG